MNRTLITAAALYLLYERQRRVERRQKLWKLRTEAELRAFCNRWGDDINNGFGEFSEGYRRWGNQLVEEINDELASALKRALKDGAR